VIIQKSNNMLTVQSAVPCSEIISGWLQLHDVELNSLVEHSRQYERAYLAWEMVRRPRNPFFEAGTGFEGYFVGILQSPNEMLDKLLEIGHSMLLSNLRLYRYQHDFRSRLMKTLTGEMSDPAAMGVWSALLGAALARFRCNIPLNPIVYVFQNETYWIVNRLPLMRYERHGHALDQEYVLAQSKAGSGPKSRIQLSTLKPADYEAGLVALLVGRFGHPLIREYLHQSSMSQS
jgi:hypothetical protein